MNVMIPDHCIEGLGLTEEKARRELALGLYADRKVTLGRAARIADIPQHEFQKLLAELGIPLHYNLQDLEADLAMVREAE
jgi:predicted HTH domain antitoxin